MEEIDLNLNIPLNIPIVSTQTKLNNNSNNKTLDALIDLLSSKQQNNIKNNNEISNSKINDYWLLYTVDKKFRDEISKLSNIYISYDNFKDIIISNKQEVESIYNSINKSFLI